MNQSPNLKKVLIEQLLTVFFQHQIKLKMYHFQTKKYGAHKASDSYLDKLASNFDKFMEVAQGAFGKVETNKININVITIDDNNIYEELDNYINILRKLDGSLKDYSELLNIRDELVADAIQLKYLLSFN